MFRSSLQKAALGLALGTALLGNQLQSWAQAGASVSAKVTVPASMKSSPFNVDRSLNIPPGFAVSVLARVPGARFMAVAPNGDILVSQPYAGKISLVRPQSSGDPLVSDWVTGLRLPHDIVFHTIGGATYVYVSESNGINRFSYDSGDLTAHDRQIVVAGLPDASSPELNGAYGHQLKNLALGPDHKLYVAIASTSTASPSDTTSDPVRCAVYQYDADGQNGRLFARGLRNAEGLAFVPGTNELWVTVNNRDNIAYPFHNDFDGDGSDDYGKVMPAYVDNHPPDEFTRVQDGAKYGWPFANPNPDTASGFDNMPFDYDVQNNPEGSSFPLSDFTPINKGIPAHSAALGVSFLQNTLVPQAYRNGAVIALHGSWNRTQRTGYKVIFYPWQGSVPGAQTDLVTGWVDSSGNVWGRPVDVVPDARGNLLISDDSSGTIYQLKPTSVPVTKSDWKALDIASNDDNTTRVLWTHTDGRAQIWTLNSARTAAQTQTTYGPIPGWTAQALAVGRLGKMRVLWTHTDGRMALWVVSANGTLESHQAFGPYAGWSARDIAVDNDGKTHVLWMHTGGTMALWRVGAGFNIETNDLYGPFAGVTAKSLAVGNDNKVRVLWTTANGKATFWTLGANKTREQDLTFGPFAGWTPTSIAVGNDGKTRALWTHSDGYTALWTLGTGQNTTPESNRVYGPFSGVTPKSLAVGADLQSRVLSTEADGRASFWLVAPDGTYNTGTVQPLSN